MKLHQLYAHLAQAKADGDTALIERLQPAIDARIRAVGEAYPSTDAAARERDAAALADLQRDYPALFGATP